MKVAANVMRSFASRVRPSRLVIATRSALVMMRIWVAAISASLARMARVSSSSARLASTVSAMTSASWAPLHATATMARSSRRRGAKMPGVSTKISWAAPSIAMPRMTARVVCTLGVTIVTLLPTIALTMVDFPTLGAPMIATKPQPCAPVACGASLEVASISTGCFHLDARLAPSFDALLDALASQHGSGGGLFGGALRAPHALRGRELREIHGDQEFRVVVRAGAGDLAIGGRRQSTRLRPF